MEMFIMLGIFFQKSCLDQWPQERNCCVIVQTSVYISQPFANVEILYLVKSYRRWI